MTFYSISSIQSQTRSPASSKWKCSRRISSFLSASYQLSSTSRKSSSIITRSSCPFLSKPFKKPKTATQKEWPLTPFIQLGPIWARKYWSTKMNWFRFWTNVEPIRYNQFVRLRKRLWNFWNNLRIVTNIRFLTVIMEKICKTKKLTKRRVWIKDHFIINYPQTNQSTTQSKTAIRASQTQMTASHQHNVNEGWHSNPVWPTWNKSSPMIDAKAQIWCRRKRTRRTKKLKIWHTIARSSNQCSSRLKKSLHHRNTRKWLALELDRLVVQGWGKIAKIKVKIIWIKVKWAEMTRNTRSQTEFL